MSTASSATPKTQRGRRFALHPAQECHHLLASDTGAPRIEVAARGLRSRRRANALAKALREAASPIQVLDASSPRHILLTTASLAVSLLLGLALGTLAALPYGLAVIEATRHDLLARAEWFALAGEFFLPGSAVLESMSRGERLGSALLFAGPIGATLSLFALALLLIDECERNVSGLAVPALLLTAPLLAGAGALLVEPAAAWLGLVPLASLLGYWLAWRFRTPGRAAKPEQDAAAPQPTHRWILAPILIAPLLLALLLGYSLRAEGGNPFITVRDHLLLPSSMLQPLSDAYYRHAPLATHAVQSSLDPYQFQVAWLLTPKPDQQAATETAERLFELGFATVARATPPPRTDGIALVVRLGDSRHDRPAQGDPARRYATLSLTIAEARDLTFAEWESRVLAALEAFEPHGARIAIAQRCVLSGLPVVMFVALGSSFALGAALLAALFALACCGTRSRPHAQVATTSVAAAVCLATCVLLLELPTWWHVQATLQGKEAAQLAEHAMNDPSPVVRGTALRRLVELQAAHNQAADASQPWATLELRRHLQAAATTSDYPVERLYATALCGLRPGPAANETLERALNDPVLNVRYTAANALGNLGNDEANHQLEQALLDEKREWYVRQYAYYALLNAVTTKQR